MRAGTLLAILLTVAAATLLFHFVVHEIAGVWLDFMLRPVALRPGMDASVLVISS